MYLKLLAKINIAIFFLILSLFIYLLWYGNLKLKNDKINIVNSQEINWGEEWKNKKSEYSGSELRFSVIKTKTVSLKVSAPNSEPDQEMEITLEGKAFFISSPDLNKKELTIHLNEDSYNKPQEIRIRFFCIYQFIPCEVNIESITVDRTAKLLPPPNLPSTLSILGDSISANFGSQNFTRYLADYLGLQLHNASIFHSTVSRNGDEIDAVSRYNKDVSGFKPDFILILMGTNDILEEIPLSEFERSYKEVVAGLKKYSPNSKIISAGIIKSKALNPNIVDDFNKAIEKISNSENIIYVDTSTWLSDGDFIDTVHPSMQAQERLKNNFSDVFSKITE